MALFFALLVACYPAAWLVAYSIRHIYPALMASGAGVYFWLIGEPLRFSLELGRLYFRSHNPTFEAWLDPVDLQSNTAFLLALFLVTPGLRPKRRFSYLGIALVLLYLSHTSFLITKIQVTFIEARHPWAGSEAIWRFWDDFFEIIGRVFFPILIWLGLALPYMLGKLDVPDAQIREAVGRNQPCPCGSGRKYKQCCLRSGK